MNPSVLPKPPILPLQRGATLPAGREFLITLETPLVSLAHARMSLKCGGEEIMDWIATGDLEWAFDLSRAKARRAFVRILAASILRMQRRDHRLSNRERAAQRLHPFAEMFDAIFPPGKPVLLSSELAGAWNCGASHIHNLVADGLLPVVEKNYSLREALQIPREAAAQFMKSRRIQ